MNKDAKALGNANAYIALPGDSHGNDQSNQRRRSQCFCLGNCWCPCTPQNNNAESADSAHAPGSAAAQAEQWFNSGNGSLFSSKRHNGGGLKANDLDAHHQRLTVSIRSQQPSWMGSDAGAYNAGADADPNPTAWGPLYDDERGAAMHAAMHFSSGSGGAISPRDDPDLRNDSGGAWSSFTSNPGSQQGNLSVDSEVSTSAV